MICWNQTELHLFEVDKVSKVTSEKQNHQQHCIVSINYCINNHNIVIFYFIFVIKNKNRCKKTTTVQQI